MWTGYIWLGADFNDGGNVISGSIKQGKISFFFIEVQLPDSWNQRVRISAYKNGL